MKAQAGKMAYPVKQLFGFIASKVFVDDVQPLNMLPFGPDMQRLAREIEIKARAVVPGAQGQAVILPAAGMSFKHAQIMCRLESAHKLQDQLPGDGGDYLGAILHGPVHKITDNEFIRILLPH